MKLIIANKNYSTWSMRPWLVLTAFSIPFEEELAPLTGEGWKQHLNAVSPTGQAPVLIDGDLVIPESLAIIEYLADRFEDKPIWPADIAARARARAAAMEMHAGFSALRSAAPMNLRASHPGRVPADVIAADLERIETIWSEALERSGGPFLFGRFSAADAMYAPVASRLKTYAIAARDTSLAWMEAIFSHPAYLKWLEGALQEPWIIERDEIDFIQRGAPAP